MWDTVLWLVALAAIVVAGWGLVVVFNFGVVAGTFGPVSAVVQVVAGVLAGWFVVWHFRTGH